MNKQKVLLFLNGEKPFIIPDVNQYDEVYCTDGSYYFLLENNIQPDVISGDFDSIDIQHIQKDLRIIQTPDQEYTDFEKALKIIIEDGHHAVDVFGASGKEQDHYIGNLNAGLKFKEKLCIRFYDNYSCYYFLESHQEIKTSVGQKISLIPFPISEGVTTKGLKYPLIHEDLQLIDRIGTRNEALEENISILFEKGNLLIFLINPST